MKMSEMNRTSKRNKTNRTPKTGDAERTSKTNKMNQTATRKPKKTHKKTALLILLGIIVLLLFLILLGLLWATNQLNKVNRTELDDDAIVLNSYSDPNMDDYTNLIFFGVDSRDGELDENTRSDSMIVVSIHNKTHKIRLLSLFRDCYVEVPGHGLTKLTHAYAYGGPELAINTINRNFDLNITDFVTVNFGTLTNVIDILGGVSINITEDEIDYVNAYTRDVARINGTKARKITKAGKQKLDGTQATAYCRVRYTAGGDFTRAKRQRTVLYAIMKKVRKAGPLTLMKIVEQVAPQIYTSLSNADMMKLALHVLQYSIEKDSGFPFENTTPTINEMSVVLPQTLTTNVSKMHKFLFKTENYIPSDTVQGIEAQMP